MYTDKMTLKVKKPIILTIKKEKHKHIFTIKEGQRMLTSSPKINDTNAVI